MNDRRGLLVALVLLVAMAGATGALSIGSPPRPTPPPTSSTTAYSLDPADRRPVVPWLASPGPPFPAPPAPVPPCQASQLRATEAGVEGATGHAAHFIEVSNAGSAPCSVSGRPIVELRDDRGRLLARSGSREPFIPSGSGTNATPEPWMVLPNSAPFDAEDRSPRGGLPFFTLAQGPCPGGVFPEGSRLYLVVRGGRVPITGIELPLAFDYRCDGSPDAYPPPGRPALLVGNFDGEPVAWFADHPAVSVEIEAPARAVAGTRMRYRVRARVTGGIDLKVYGCPAYTQRLGVREERHLLNCAALEDRPGRLLFVDQRFEMLLSVPRNVRAGPQSLSWELDPPFRARAAATVEVVRR